MSLDDIDDSERKRVSGNMEAIRAGKSDVECDFFTSENVVKTLSVDKPFLNSFDFKSILTLMPFFDVMYVCVCKNCIDRNNVDKFRVLVESGYVIPIMTSRYGEYLPEVRDFILNHDHISRHEFSAYRYLSILSYSKRGICDHCVDAARSRILERAQTLLDDPRAVRKIEVVFSNISPFVEPDSDATDDLEKAVVDKDNDKLNQIYSLSWTLRNLRSSVAFGGRIRVDENDLTFIPKGIFENIDNALDTAYQTRRRVTDGLGLRIPTDIPLRDYIEIAREFSKPLRVIVNKIEKATSARSRSLQAHRLNTTIMKLNSEVERISLKKRSIILNGTLDFYSHNAMIMNAAFVGAALGITKSAVGCAGGAAATAGITAAVKYKWVQSGEDTRRLLRTAEASFRPYFDKLTAGFLGSSPLAVTVMSVKRGVSRRVQHRLPQVSKKPLTLVTTSTPTKVRQRVKKTVPE